MSNSCVSPRLSVPGSSSSSEPDASSASRSRASHSPDVACVLPLPRASRAVASRAHSLHRTGFFRSLCPPRTPRSSTCKRSGLKRSRCARERRSNARPPSRLGCSHCVLTCIILPCECGRARRRRGVRLARRAWLATYALPWPRGRTAGRAAVVVASDASDVSWGGYIDTGSGRRRIAQGALTTVERGLSSTGPTEISIKWVGGKLDDRKSDDTIEMGFSGSLTGGAMSILRKSDIHGVEQSGGTSVTVAC